MIDRSDAPVIAALTKSAPGETGAGLPIHRPPRVCGCLEPHLLAGLQKCPDLFQAQFLCVLHANVQSPACETRSPFTLMLRKYTVIAAALLTSAAFADSVIVIIPGFATPAIACVTLGYAYQGTESCGNTSNGLPFPQQDFNSTSSFGWTLGPNGDGLTGSNMNFQTPSFTGLPFSQAVFLQGLNATVLEDIAGFEHWRKLRSQLLSRVAFCQWCQ